MNTAPTPWTTQRFHLFHGNVQLHGGSHRQRKLPPMTNRPLVCALGFAAGTLALACNSNAVTLSGEGTGQALVYPYFTAKTSRGNPFNTYVSIVNHADDAKALRVRFRDTTDGIALASFNVFLSPGDVWTAAVVPTASGSRLITADRSCTSPVFSGESGLPVGIPLVDPTGGGTTGEGWIQVLEMATLTGSSAAAVAHDASGMPSNCGVVQGTAVETSGPTGGLSGTLTLINVASGMDFTMSAEALSDLGTRSYYRVASDAYPDFNVPEIDPVSVVVANGAVYRSAWTRAEDAISAVYMRRSFAGEFALDAATNSNTDFIIAFPTRQHYLTQTANLPPFAADCRDQVGGEGVVVQYRNWEQTTASVSNGQTLTFRCRAVGSFDMRRSTQPAGVATAVLASQPVSFVMPGMPDTVPNGWLHFNFTTARSLTSLPTSTKTVISSGAVINGAHIYTGLPMTGFMVRTLENGTLTCATGSCQGNYGGNMPLQYSRSITP